MVVLIKDRRWRAGSGRYARAQVHDGEGSNEQVLLGESLLDEIVRDGARRMLAAALRAEVAAYIEAHVGEVGADVRKGLYLAQHIYRDLGTRPMADMDLLTTRRDCARAVEILGDLGYQMGDTTPDSRRVVPLPRDQAAFWRLHVNNLAPLFRTTSDPTVLEFIVDISAGLFLPRSEFTVPTDEILDRAVPAPFGDVDMLVQAPEDLVLDLCAHLYKESTTLRYLHRLKHQRLIQYCDLREVLAVHGDTWFGERSEARVGDYGVGPVGQPHLV